MKNLMAMMALLVSAITNAAPVTWTLNNYVFDDGGTASGSFVMDSVSKEITAANIVTTSGSAFVGESYSAIDAEYGVIITAPPSFMQFYTDNLPGRVNETVFVLELGAGFDASGGTYSTKAGEYRCNHDLYCPSDNVLLRSIQPLSGSITSVPIPAAVWLFGSALGGLGWMRRRRTI
jgi:hypothetical protein